MKKPVLLLLPIIGTLSCFAQKETSKPNIIFFLVDDMGWQDTSVPFWEKRTKLNDQYHTPNMEVLASQGVKFTQAYACPLSSPTRVSLMTGLNSARHHVTNWTLRKNISPDVPHKELDLPKWNINGLSPVPDIEGTCYVKTLPMFLREAGYTTIHIGKAHWGAKGTPGEDPLNLGFDVNIAGHAPGGPGSYYGKYNFSAEWRHEDRIWDVPGLEKYHGKDINITEALTLEANDQLEKAVQKGKPFYLYMSHYAVHAPWEKDERFYQKYKDAGLSEFAAVYASMLESMDKSLGDILSKVNELGIGENTIIIFMSDNGSPSQCPQNEPLRGHKITPYEGGIRDPMIVKWPGVTKAGSVCNGSLIIEDFFPSILEMAGVKKYSQIGGKIDGKSFVSLLRGKKGTSENRQFVWHFPHNYGLEPYSVIREGDWKLIYWYKESKLELYNIPEDISESKDLAKVNPSKTKDLAIKLGNYLREANAGRPSFKATGQPCFWPDQSPQLGNKIEIVQKTEIDLSKPGRTYERIGALSAGASTRLLMDYAEPYRSQVLDFLFKPKYGASLQHLKVEIGGDVNSTCGTEPSHARTREEFENPKPEYFQRGYEWWLMKEAKKRNPDIFLDCLEWGAPGWIGDGKYYSQDNINYIIAFIKGAKQYHDLKIDFTGIWNERMYDIEFIKNLRKALDDNGLNEVKVIGADLCCHQQWLIADDMKKDDALRNAVSVIGDHYPERDKAYNSNDNAKSFGIPIWNNEGGPWKGDWSGFEYLAKMYNRDYIEGRMTKNITWSLITSYFNNLSLPNSGLMTANTPWSGFYDVEPAVWAVAHTTQFAEPGWKYIDSACGYLDSKGSYVTMTSPSTNSDFSIIAETMDATQPQTITFRIGKSEKIRKIYVWRTILKGNLFEQQVPISIRNNEFTVTLEPKALYTFTTTTGQQKAMSTPAENKPFPFPFKAGFEDEKFKTTPKYFSDQGGAFEVAQRNDGKGNCLRQLITRRAIEWEESPIFNQTVVGDTVWTDYSVSCELLFQEPYSYASVLSRATEMHRSHKQPEAYQLKLQSSGKWELMAGAKKLLSGLIIPEKNRWQFIQLEVKSDKIKAIINGITVAEITDKTYTHGMAGLGCSFNQVDFDNFTVNGN